MTMKFALITGVNGQDGSYLAEFLLERGYTVIGTIRRTSYFNLKRIDHLRGSIKLVYADVSDGNNMTNIITGIKNDMNLDTDTLEVYNLAAQSHVAVSFEMPNYTSTVDALGTLNVLESIRITGMVKNTKFYQASTSELYGKVLETPQTEATPFYPRSPYAVAKMYAHWITKNYRESYDMFACSGILFNHSSPRRGENFILRKITLGVAKYLKDNKEILCLGNLDAKRDIGHSRDFVKGMWLMLQQETPDDFVLATGKQYSIRDFVEIAFSIVGINIGWRGSGLNEEGYDVKTGDTLVQVNSRYYRPCEVETLLGNAEKAKCVLGWESTTTITDLIKEMVENDIKE